MQNQEGKPSVHLSDAAAEQDTVGRAEEDLREDKSASTAAGEFVREEIDHIREGRHGARSTKQAIAIGLSKARRAGVPLGVPERGQVSERTRESAERETKRGATRTKPSAKRSRAATSALKREPRSTVSKQASTLYAHQARGSQAKANRQRCDHEASYRRCKATANQRGMCPALSPLSYRFIDSSAKSSTTSRSTINSSTICTSRA